MKITRILAYRVELPLRESSYKWSGGKSVTVFDSTIVRVETNTGLVGHGEVCPLGPFYLAAYADLPRPQITIPLVLWENLKRGDIGAAAWLTIDVTARLIGTLIGLFALAAPFLLMRRNDERGVALLGTWLICASCVAVYIPVHLDIRYLVPLIPLHCLLGATLWHAYRPHACFARPEAGQLLSH